MPSSSLHIVLYNWLKPFLEEAKQKGFHVSPDTHIKIVAVLAQCADKIEDETALFDYFSPIIAKNKEDYQLLKGEWEKWCGREKLVVDRKAPGKKRKPRYRWLIVSSVSVLALLIVWFLYTHFIGKSIVANYVISYTDVTQPVQFDASSSFTGKTDTSGITFVWNFGDGMVDTSGKAIIKHSYQKTGQYNSSLTLLSRSSDVALLNREMKTPFTLCKPKPQITQQPDAISIHQKIVFSVAYDSLFPSSGKNEWKINNKTVAQNQALLTTQFDSAGTQTITYTDRDYNAGSACDSTTETSVTIQSASGISFYINQNSKALEPPLKVNEKTVATLLFLLLGLGVFYYYNKRKIAKKRGSQAQRSTDILNSLKGMKPPYEIPLKSNDDVIDDEPLLPALAKNFKRRVADENLYLNIPLTIASTIRSEGFLLPVFTQKTKPSEYLILIDKNYVKSAQVKLFEYLVKRFAKSDIFTDTFYLYDKPDYGFNAFYPKGIYISRLYDLYPDHTVIIFGNGYSFIDKYYPSLTEATTLPYTKWTNHAIFTPVPYNDWSGKEMLLQKRFLLLPADMEGQLLLFNFIDKPETFTSLGLQSLQSSYKTKGFNANKAEKLKKYLDNEFLFQWLCALAVSPSIYWQTMLGIGDALQKERYYSEVIQYSSLLKLVRISWMRDAAFPEEVRLDLLKNLEPQNEKIARQAMIRMMEEASLKTDENSFAFEELYLQQITDKFVLYASDANNEEFKDYKTAHDEFKALWKDDKITDVVLKEYLKKEDGGDWSTLIGNENLRNNPQASISINSLFNDHLTSSKARWLRIQNAAILLLIFLMVLFTASIFLFKNNWNNTFINDKHTLVSADSSAMVPFTFSVVYNQCFNGVQRQKDATVFTLDFGNNNLLSLATNDTAKLKKIPYAWLNTKQIALHISSQNEAYHFDSSFLLSSTRLSLSINGCPVYCNHWTKKQRATLDARYNGDWYDKSFVNSTNESYASVHIEPGSVNGEAIAEIGSCADNPSLLRIITRNKEGNFSLYYLSQMQSGAIQYAKHEPAYQALEEAEKDSSAFTQISLFAILSSYDSFVNSHNFFATFNGQWKTDANADIIDISGKQNIMTLDSKYTLTVTSEQQSTTVWGKRLYKLSILQNGVPIAKKPFIYVLLIDSTTAYLSSEEQDSGTIIYKIANMGIFQRMHKQNTTTTETAATLPQSLNEIWQRGTSDRLITLFLPKNIIYVSTNDVSMYNSYSIDKVFKLSDGSCKIIAKTNQGYKLFFIKNISPTSFDLSACQDIFNLNEATSKTAADCGSFDKMSLYYENDPSVIYLPVTFSNNLMASQQAKLNKIVAAVNTKTATIISFNVMLPYTPPNLSNTVNAMNSFLHKNGINSKITAGDVNSSVINRPFTRSYIKINTASVADVSMPVQTTVNSDVKQETNTEINIGNIQFDEKSGMPDSKSLQLIAAAAKQLKNDTTSRVKINFYYKTKEDYKTGQQYLSEVFSMFKKENISVNAAFNNGKPLQIDLILHQVQQMAATKSRVTSRVTTDIHYILISLSGINFPANFTATPSQKY